MTDIEKLSPDIVKLNTVLAKNQRDELAFQVRQKKLDPAGINNEITLPALVPQNTLDDNGDGQTNLLPVDQFATGIVLQVVEWPTIRDGDYLLTFSVDGDDFARPHTVQRPFGSVDIAVPLGSLEFEHGPHTVSWKAMFIDDENTEYGAATEFFIDLYDPDMNRQPEKIALPGDLPNGNQITPDYLDTHGGVTFTIPTPTDHRADDIFSLYIGAREVIIDQPLVAPFTVVVPRAEFDAEQGGVLEITYALADRAGNRSALSVPETVRLVKTPAPVLSAPVIPEGPAISLADARDGVLVMDQYDPGMNGDFITVSWNGVIQDSYFWPGTCTVSFADIFSLGRQYSGNVTYEVNRDGIIYQSPPTPIDVDLTFVGPENPNEPDPVNPDLDPLSLKSSTGLDNEIGMADKDAAATITVPVYDLANQGEMIEVFYGGTSVGEHELQAGDIVAGVITMDLPWDLIKEKGNGTIPAHYRIFLKGLPENAQYSVDTPIAVTVNNLAELPIAVFSNRNVNRDIINCDVAPWINGVHVQMTYEDFEAGDIVTIDWVCDQTYPDFGDPVIPSDPLEATRKEFPHEVTVAEAAAGQVTFVVPWGPHMLPIIRGSFVVFWRLERDNGAISGTSLQSYVRLSREGPTGAICGPIP